MVSLSSDLTDAKGRRAPNGWVFFDADCPFCTRIARRMLPVLEPRGFGLAALQDARAQALLGLSGEVLLQEMRLLTSDGRQFGGADAFIEIARRVWWAWPFYALSSVPGMRSLMRVIYRKVAARRSCSAGTCRQPATQRGSGARL